MTVGESRFLESATHFFTKFLSPNWEQRRYEIAKELYCKAVNQHEYTAAEAVDKADKFIKILKDKTKDYL